MKKQRSELKEIGNVKLQKAGCLSRGFEALKLSTILSNVKQSLYIHSSCKKSSINAKLMFCAHVLAGERHKAEHRWSPLRAAMPCQRLREPGQPHRAGPVGRAAMIVEQGSRC